VTLNGASAAAVALELRLFDGTSYSTVRSTLTGQDGAYNFIDAPSLASGKSYYVRFQNSGNTLGELWFWGTRNITSYAAGGGVAAGDFDLADVALTSPPNQSTLLLPVTFQWARRSGISTDSYQLAIFDFTDGNPFAQTPLLGYVGGVTVSALPGTFQSHVPYAWEVLVNSPDGGQGISLGTRRIMFTDAATGAVSGGADLPLLVPGWWLMDWPLR